MNSPSPNPGRWIESLRHIGESLTALLRSRFELFTVKWQEEKLRLFNLLVWLGLAAAIGVAGMFVALFALAFIAKYGEDLPEIRNWKWSHSK